MTRPTILCPIDFSECSRRALAYAGGLAAHFGARLIVLHTTDPTAAGAILTFESYMAGDQGRKQVLDFICPVVSRERSQSAGPDVVLAFGDPATEILRVAHEQSADLLVVGTHGLSGYRKLLFGSTTQRILSRTDVPVLAVSGFADVPAAPADPLLDHGPILAPFDFTDVSRRAVRIAAGIAASLELPLLIVHAVQPGGTLFHAPEEAVPTDEARIDAAFEGLRDLAASLPDAVKRDVAVVTGQPADEIAHIACAHHAALIVMALEETAGAFHRRGAGAVSYRILAQAPVPVLAIPFHDKPERPHLQEMLCADGR